MPNPIINKKLVVFGTETATVYDADAAQFFTLLSPQPSTAVKEAYNTLVVGLKADGNYTQIERFWIFAADSQQNAMVHLIVDGAAPAVSTDITEVNSPTWTQHQGYTGDGATSYLNLNYNPTTHGTLYTQDSATMGVYIRTNAASDGIDVGALDTSVPSRSFIISRHVTNIAYGLINQNLNSITGATITNSKGFSSTIRTGASVNSIYKNGVSV